MSILRLLNSKSIAQCMSNYSHLFSNPHSNTVSKFPVVVSRSYHLTSKNNTPLHPRTPDLVYFPQVIRWLKTKIGFKVLQKTWDPDFSEGAFICGTTQAICRITQLISNNDKDDELKELVTPLLRKKLLTIMKMHLTDLQKKVIVLSPKDIKLLIPLEVRMNQLQNRKHCAVGLRSLAIKWQEVNGNLRLAIIALQTEFVRDYTDELSRNFGWTVRLFDILECGIIGDAKQIQK